MILEKLRFIVEEVIIERFVAPFDTGIVCTQFVRPESHIVFVDPLRGVWVVVGHVFLRFRRIIDNSIRLLRVIKNVRVGSGASP